MEAKEPQKLSEIVTKETPMYRDWWYILDEMPDGWDKVMFTGSPVSRSIFIYNKKSYFSGQREQAILKLKL